MKKPVYDIINCGPRHRFVANGKLVCNSNMLNLTRGSKLRQGLVAPEGHVLVWGDKAQEEFRLTGWFAGCESLLDAFREGRDVYTDDAEEFFRCEITKELRRLMKETDLGCGYGMGYEKFHHYLEVKGIKVERSVSDALINFFRKRRKEIPAMWRRLDRCIQCMDIPGYEETIGPIHIIGRKVYLPNGMFLDYTSTGLDKIWGGRFLENIIQALAWIDLATAWRTMRRAFDARGRGCVVLPVYDELVCCVPLTDKQWCLDMLGTALVTVPEWAPNLPLAAELFSGDRYDKSSSEAISRTSKEN